MTAHDRTRLIGPSRKFEKQARKSDERRVAGIYLLEGLPKKDAVFLGRGAANGARSPFFQKTAENGVCVDESAHDRTRLIGPSRKFENKPVRRKNKSVPYRNALVLQIDVSNSPYLITLHLRNSSVNRPK